MKWDGSSHNISEYIRQIYKMSNSLHSLRNMNLKLKTGVQSDVIINYASLSTLNVIDMYSDENSNEISRRLGITKSAVSQMIGKLEKQGLIERRKKEGNKKEFYPYLTEKGKKCVSDYRFFHEQFYKGFDDIIMDYTDDQKEAIWDFLCRSNGFLDVFGERQLSKCSTEK